MSGHAAKSPRFCRLAAAALLAGAAVLLAVTVADGPAAHATVEASAHPWPWGVVQRDSPPGRDRGPGELELPGRRQLAAAGSNSTPWSCPASGDCTAGGEFTGQGLNDGTVGEGWVATESGGTWTAPKIVEPRSGGFPSYVEISAISCASPGNCAAVGYDSEEVEANGYVDTYGAFYLSEVNGKGSCRAQGRSGAPTRSTRELVAKATSVSCSAPGDCAVTGNVNGSQEFVDTETNGVWGTAALAPGSSSRARPPR